MIHDYMLADLSFYGHYHERTKYSIKTYSFDEITTIDSMFDLNYVYVVNVVSE